MKTNEITNKALVKLNPQDLIEIHKALHDKRKKFVTLSDGSKKEIILFEKNNLRQFIHNNVLFTQQETSKDNFLSNLAKKGEKITWGMSKNNWWFAMYDNQILNNRYELLKSIKSKLNI